MKRRAIVTLATGSQYYSRMALALMISAQKFGGNRYDYFIFSDKEKIPYYNVPDWLNIVKLSDRYFQSKSGQTAKGEGFRLKSMLLSDEAIANHDALFLDADCYVFKDNFDEIFDLIHTQSMVIYGKYLMEGETWGKIKFQEVAAKAGFTLKNMWLNSGFIGRAADKWGFLFIDTYETLMKDYLFKQYIQSKFWQTTDEPYLAAAFQIVYQQKYQSLPDYLPSVPSEIFITTYNAKVDTKKTSVPIVHSKYVNGSFQPAIIHFLNGIDSSYYRRLINQTVSFNLEGAIMRPYFRGKYSLKKLKYYYKKLTNWNVTESRDV